jgi:hypothetical protein
MNGNAFPGTVERLSGIFYDEMRIVRSQRAVDLDPNDAYPLDTIVTIEDSPRADIDTLSIKHVVNRYPTDPSSGAPIRPGTGYVDDETGQHLHRGHNIANSKRKQGVLVEIMQHADGENAAPYTTLNGHHYACRYKNSTTQLRIPSFSPSGTLRAGGVGLGGRLRVWRRHKSSRENPMLQNNGASGTYTKLNEGEVVAIRFINAANTQHPIHLHGHQWRLFAIDGNIFDTPRFQNSVSIESGVTMDVLFRANNPNHVGAWMFHCHVLHHLTNTDNPWPLSGGYPGGMQALIDYTGNMQGRFVISETHQPRLARELPPACSVAAKQILASRDVLGDVRTSSSGAGVTLTATVTLVDNQVTRMAYGEIVRTTWTLVSKPSEAAGPVTFSNKSSPVSAVSGFSVDGEYVFRFVAVVRNFDRAAYGGRENDTVSCEVTQSVIVSSAILNHASDAAISAKQPLTNVFLPDKSYNRGMLSLSLTSGSTLNHPRLTVLDSSRSSNSTPFLPVVSTLSGLIDAFHAFDGSRAIIQAPLDPRLTLPDGLSVAAVNLLPGNTRGAITLPLTKAILKVIDCLSCDQTEKEKKKKHALRCRLRMFCNNNNKKKRKICFDALKLHVPSQRMYVFTCPFIV